MKILIVSMRSIHTIRWVSQLENSGHEVHWFDILNGGYINEWRWVRQHTNWRYKFGDFKGRFFLKKYLPKLHCLFENNVEEEFEKLVNKIKPDAVHSFALHIGAFPILTIMKKYPNINWIYSSWGSDLFYHKEFPDLRKQITEVLPYIDFYFSDCNRDLDIVKSMGFNGTFLGVFPGGGGYNLSKLNEYILPVSERKTIAIKGYHTEFAKGLIVVKAILAISEKIKDFEIFIYSADKEIVEFCKNKDTSVFKDFRILSIEESIQHVELLRIFGKTLVSIGNNISDGIPNTLLETICLGGFPIQSNPGGATEEIIINNKNGLLIEDPFDQNEIEKLILNAIQSKQLVEDAFKYNQEIKTKFEYTKIKKAVQEAYSLVK